MNPWNRLFHPLHFQGTGRTSGYFEGWYYKSVTADGHSLALIPGVSLEGSGHSFIQLISGSPPVTRYFSFPLSDFHWNHEPFSIRIGENIFTRDSLHLQLQDGPFRAEGALSFSGHIPIPHSLLWPNSMGPFAYIPRMECNHGVIFLDMQVDGSMQIGPQTLTFRGGRGYLEKDWGTSFPQNYLWMQCNSFTDVQASLILSIARIPWMGHSFTGLLGFLQISDQQYRFATYNGTRLLSRKTDEHQLELVMANRLNRLEVQATRTQGALLKAPSRGRMEMQIRETLQSTVSFKLLDNRGNLLHQAQGYPAGLEIVEALS